MYKGALGNSAVYSIVCGFAWSVKVLKEVLGVVCLGVKFGKKGMWISFP